MKDRKIIDTKHSIERFIDKNRFDQTKKNEFKKSLDKVIKDAMNKIITKHNDKSGVYGIHSKSTGIGVVIDWRLDRQSSDKLNHAIIITILPIKKIHNFRDLEAEVIVEKILKESIPKFKESSLEARVIHKGKFKVVLWEGIYYDNNATWIFVR
jgi:hypothetical protein